MKKKHKTSQEYGSIGGKKTKEKYGVEHYRKIGLLGSRVRWGLTSSVKNGIKKVWENNIKE